MSTGLTLIAAWHGRLSAEREAAIDRSVALLAALSLPTLTLVLLRATVVGWLPQMAVSIAITIALCGTHFVRGRLPAAAKAAVVLGVLFVAAVNGLISFGLASYGAMYFVAAVVLTTLLLGPHWGTGALGAAVAMACALTVAVAAHRLSVSVDLNAYNAAPVAWLGLPVTLVWPAGTLLAVGGRLYGALVDELRVSAEQAEALRRSERDFRLLAENSADVIVRYTPDMRLLYASPAVRQLLGFAPEEIVGRSSSEFVHPEDRAAAEQARRPIQTEGVTASATYRCLRADGSYVWVESVGRAVYDEATGETVEIQVATRDISARKAAEEALVRANAELARANAELETLLRVLPVGIGIVDDPAANRIRMNPALAQMLGLPPDANASLTAPEGERPTTFKVYQGGRELTPDELPFSKAVATGEDVRDMELQVVRDDGVRLTQLGYASPLRGEEGRVRGAVGAMLDISARVQAERQRDLLLAGLAHDLKNPLAGLVWLAEILQREAAEPDQAEILGSFVQGARQMMRQVNELVDTARGQLGRPLGLVLRRVDLAELVGRLAAEQAQMSRGISIRVEGAEGPLPGLCDEARLGRALANVLGNAVKYSTPDGEVSVSLARAEGEAGGWATIRVADRGIGIPAAEAGWVFEPFFRASNARRQAEGSGLGLAGVRQVVEAHGGSVELESEEGVGTAVTIRLPLRPPGLEGGAEEAP